MFAIVGKQMIILNKTPTSTLVVNVDKHLAFVDDKINAYEEMDKISRVYKMIEYEADNFTAEYDKKISAIATAITENVNPQLTQIRNDIKIKTLDFQTEISNWILDSKRSASKYRKAQEAAKKKLKFDNFIGQFTGGLDFIACIPEVGPIIKETAKVGFQGAERFLMGEGEKVEDLRRAPPQVKLWADATLKGLTAEVRAMQDEYAQLHEQVNVFVADFNEVDRRNKVKTDPILVQLRNDVKGLDNSRDSLNTMLHKWSRIDKIASATDCQEFKLAARTVDHGLFQIAQKFQVISRFLQLFCPFSYSVQTQ